MLTCCVCAGAWAQTQGTAGSVNVPTVKRSSGTVNQVIVVKGGERQGVIKIQLAGSANCRDMQFDLTLPAGITLAEAPTTEEPVKMVEATDANHVLFYALDGQTVKIAVVDKVAALDANVVAGEVENATSYGQYLANDIVFELPIAVASTFEGVKDATIANLAFTDDAATADIAVTGTTTFTIDALLLGDVTDDGAVNMGDAQAITFHSLGATPSVFIQEVGDVEENTKIDMGDAQRITFNFLDSSAKEAIFVEDVNENELDPE